MRLMKGGIVVGNLIRTNLKIKYFVFFILLLSNIAFAEEPIRLELENKDNNLRLYLINSSPNKILINKEFRLGPPVDPVGHGEIAFEIFDKAGNKCPLGGFIDYPYNQEIDTVLLFPGEFIGIEFKIEDLIRYYWITEVGVYKARAIYKNKVEELANQGVYNERLTTDWIDFEVTEKTMEDARGKDWRERTQKALEIRRKSEEREKALNEEYKKRNK